MAITALIPPPYRLLAAGIAALALAGAGFAAGWTFQGWKSSAVLAEVQADHGEQVRKAMKAERDGLASVLAEERALRNESQGVANEAKARLAVLDAAAAGLSGDLGRLRDERRRYSAARACTPGTAAAPAGGGLAGPAAGVVSGDGRDIMLDEAEDALAALAPALDIAHTKHTACAAAYTKARERLMRMGSAGRTIEGAP